MNKFTVIIDIIFGRKSILYNPKKMSKKCDEKLRDKVNEWLEWDKNEKTRDKLKKLVAENNVDVLQKKLLERIAFGTAGLRGVMDVGYSCMNDLVVIQTAQGFLKFLESDRNELLLRSGIVLGYDARYNSKKWAELTATIFVNAGVPVRLFKDFCVTPMIPFAIRKYGCAAGVVVTASHNPKEDNGYKVYDSNGAQIISPTDKNVQDAILNNLKPWESSWNVEVLNGHKLVSYSDDEVIQMYLNDIITDSVCKEDIENNKKSAVTFTYTPMHGVGYQITQKVMDTIGVKIVPVKEQRDPDPEFSTVKFPNPEEGKSSLDLAIKTAEANNSKVILAHDPDADRFAFAEKNSKTGEWKIFSGNELGAVFGYWMLHCFRKKHPDFPMKKLYMISSTVSSMILKSLAQAEGFNFVDTLTGFKWIGNKCLELESQGNKVVFGFEEAIGFMCDSHIVDKDGVSASAHFATCVSHLYAEGKQVIDQLEEIYKLYGLHISNNSYYFCHEQPKINRIFDRIRNWDGKQNNYPEGIINNKYKVRSVRDLTTGFDNSQPGNRAVLPVSCSSQMITFIFENGLHCTLRTSGTEPKIKYYTEMCASIGVTDKEAVVNTLNEMVTAICEEFCEPTKNGLVHQSA